MRHIALLLTPILLQLGCGEPGAPEPDDRPNILWITSEDNGPHLGAYGDGYADTPNLDALADQGMIFTNAWSNAPVCAPARTTIATGVYPTSLGAQHMRSLVALPEGMGMYPQLLRDAGYYVANNAKEDFNVTKPGQVWDESSREAHWRDRPNPDQPFFAVFNLGNTHESQIRARPHEPTHDPDSVRIPAYHPDAPEVRQDWAQYYDKMTEMDGRAGEILAQLEEDGLSASTIVFYYGDHGPGLPRSKRSVTDSGLRVPLIVHVPEGLRHLAPGSWEPGGATDRPVAFVDLAPTVLSLGGVEPPEYMQGRAFLGPHAREARTYNYGFRGRMDERYDMARAVRDDRFVYVRNYHPHRIYGQHVAYMFQTPTTQTWKRLFDEGGLPEAQAAFWRTKPAEELYDLLDDPDETINLAESPEHQEKLDELRRAEREWVTQIRDLGFLPEAEIHSRAGEIAPYTMGRDPERYPLDRILAAAELAAAYDPGDVPDLVALLDEDDPAVRYWGVMGLQVRGAPAVEEARAALLDALEDPSPTVRVAAAEALGRFGPVDAVDRALALLVSHANPVEYGLLVAVPALNALDQMDERALSVLAEIEALPEEDPAAPPRLANGGYVARLKAKIVADLRAP